MPMHVVNRNLGHSSIMIAVMVAIDHPLAGQRDVSVEDFADFPMRQPADAPELAQAGLATIVNGAGIVPGSDHPSRDTFVAMVGHVVAASPRPVKSPESPQGAYRHSPLAEPDGSSITAARQSPCVPRPIRSTCRDPGIREIAVRLSLSGTNNGGR